MFVNGSCIAWHKKHVYIMCTVTLEYSQNSALARRKLAALLATGLFTQKDVKPDTPTPEEVEAHRKFIQDFLTPQRLIPPKHLPVI